jgi:hypothetical protein
VFAIEQPLNVLYTNPLFCQQDSKKVQLLKAAILAQTEYTVMVSDDALGKQTSMARAARVGATAQDPM